MEQKKQDLGLVVGANLKRLIRESKYRTQENFACEFGTDVRTVGRWVNKGVDSLETIGQLAKFLDTDVFTLLSE